MSEIHIPESDDPDGVVVATVATRAARNRERSGSARNHHPGPVVGLVTPRLHEGDTEELLPNDELVEDPDQELFMSCQLTSSFGEEKGKVVVLVLFSPSSESRLFLYYYFVW